MPVRSLVFGSAVGTGWTDPDKALSLDGQAAVWPGGSSPVQWLRLTDASDRSLPLDTEVVGFRLTVTALGSGYTPPFGTMAQGWRGQTVDEGLSWPSWAQHGEDAYLAWDEDDATWYGEDDYSGTTGRAVSVAHDLGSPYQVTRVRTVFRYGQSQSYVARWAYSANGTDWAEVPFDEPHGFADPDTVYTDDRELEVPVTARYWRFRLQDGNEQGDQTRPRVHEFQLYDGPTRLTGGAGGDVVERLQVALTKDGSAPAGEVRTVSIGAGGGTYLVGAVDDLWGALWSPAEVGAATFGVVVRRADLAGETVASDRRVDHVALEVAFESVEGSLMPREFPLQKCLLGKESTHGVPVAPTVMLRSARLDLQPSEQIEEERFQGEVVPGVVRHGEQFSTGALAGVPCYNELGLVLRGLFGEPVTTNLGSGAFRHEFDFDPRGQSPMRTYTCEWGDQNFCERFAYVLINSLEVSTRRNEPPSLSGTAFARRMEFDDAPPAIAPGVSAVQTVTLTGSPTGGTFRLRFKGAETSDIAYNAGAAAVQSALQALSTVGSGNATVSGSAGGPWTVTFAGALAGVYQPLLERAANNLTGGTSPDVATAVTTLGGYTEYRPVPVEAAHLSVYSASTLAGLASGKLGSCFMADFAIAERHRPVYVLDDSLDSFKEATESDTAVTMRVLIEANSASAPLIAAYRDSAYRWLRAVWQSKVTIPGSSTPYRLEATMSAHVTSLGNRGDDQSIVAREFAFSARFEPSWGRALRLVLTNEVSAY
ncbi:MAG: discoidin domain-containing protein [Fimbriimonadaceae bacterium]|nr:discoidin domain-containing protein [Fimbriimonadaceae bacterium]QYK58008.1 MAG: discoidin domain-containing protein [Fimbriimonadaceae bacterium]